MKSLIPNASPDNILNKLYCMLNIAGWIKKISYSGKDYYHATVEGDPFGYSYKTGTAERDTLRRKADIASAMKAIEDTPQTVLNRALAGRKPRVK